MKNSIFILLTLIISTNAHCIDHDIMDFYETLDTQRLQGVVNSSKQHNQDRYRLEVNMLKKENESRTQKEENIFSKNNQEQKYESNEIKDPIFNNPFKYVSQNKK